MKLAVSTLQLRRRPTSSLRTSVIGVSRTRSGPYFCKRPLVICSTELEGRGSRGSRNICTREQTHIDQSHHLVGTLVLAHLHKAAHTRPQVAAEHRARRQPLRCDPLHAVAFARRPTSSPKIYTSLSFSISSSIAEFNASRTVICKDTPTRCAQGREEGIWLHLRCVLCPAYRTSR